MELGWGCQHLLWRPFPWLLAQRQARNEVKDLLVKSEKPKVPSSLMLLFAKHETTPFSVLPAQSVLPGWQEAKGKGTLLVQR